MALTGCCLSSSFSLTFYARFLSSFLVPISYAKVQTCLYWNMTSILSCLCTLSQAASLPHSVYNHWCFLHLVSRSITILLFSLYNIVLFLFHLPQWLCLQRKYLVSSWKALPKEALRIFAGALVSPARPCSKLWQLFSFILILHWQCSNQWSDNRSGRPLFIRYNKPSSSWLFAKHRSKVRSLTPTLVCINNLLHF